MKRRQFAALAGATLAAPAVFAQNRTTRILVGFAPGGSADVIARLMAEKMGAALGQNVIVDNKPGAAGRLVLGELLLVVTSRVYSICLSRQSTDSAWPWPGNSCSASRPTLNTSNNVPYASNSTALGWSMAVLYSEPCPTLMPAQVRNP